MPQALQCHGCRHYEWGALDRDRCNAYPDGIPDAIWNGGADHALAHPGDGGVRLLPLDSASRAEGVKKRHRAWASRGVERFVHASDPLGAIVAGIDRSAGAASLDPQKLVVAWQRSSDAPAALLVLLRANRLGALAQAIKLTATQLEAEGCDILDNKAWLGVGLCLGTYQHDSAMTNLRTVWSALTSPFGDGYVTARVQQTLLRSIRRVFPEPPPAIEWANPEQGMETDPLDDRVVALRLAPPKKGLRVEDLKLLEPWVPVTNAKGLEEELARELVPGHRLHGRAGLRAVATRNDGADVLFVGEDLAVVVHLTWAKEVDPTTPAADIYPSLDEWVARRMQPEHHTLTGAEPRAFAFAFRSTLSIDAMLERLPDKARWDWTISDSNWYGRYVWAKDGATRVRIFAEDEAERFTIQAERVEDDPQVSAGWYGAAGGLTATLLAAIEAADVQPCAPKSD
ncbi:MAG: hypothetical protein KF819_12340 [Labilithrix sp.]|nr:hypothetical protein [Labilithrix sp.]